MSNLALNLFQDVIVLGLDRATLRKASTWAEKCVPFFSFNQHPWAYELVNFEGPIGVARKGAQLGFTVALGLVKSLHTLDQKKKDVLYVLPTADEAMDFSDSRFDPILNSSDYVNAMFTNTKNKGLKQTGLNTLYLRGSRSESKIRSIPVYLIVADEYDIFTKKSILMLRERMSGQEEKQFLAPSTPSLPDKGVDELYNLSNKSQYTFKCPRCARFIILKYPDSLIITGDSIVDPALRKSHLICTECKGTLPHGDKINFLKNRAHGGTAFWQYSIRDREITGWHMGQLYSFTVSPKEIAQAAIEASMDPVADQQFHNNKLGLPHVVKGAKVTEDDIKACRANYLLSNHKKATDGLYIMGVDQGGTNYIEIDKVVFNRQSNDLNAAATILPVYINKEESFDTLCELMQLYKVKVCVIDAMPETRKAYEFASKFPGQVFLCYFGNNVKTKEIRQSEGAKYAEISKTVDRTLWFDTALNRFKTQSITIPFDCPQEYINHILVPVKIPERDRDNNLTGRYDSREKEDHFALSRVYAEIGLGILSPGSRNIINPLN